MSIFQKGVIDLKRILKKHVVTIMLSFPFFLEKKCDANFYHIFLKGFKKYY